MKIFTWLIIANSVIGFSAVASAQDSDFGKMVYKSSCGACHGEDGKGNGPLSAELKSKPSDLSVLAKNNNGVFPVEAMYEIIDARKTIRAHGDREMPVWGYGFISFGPDSQQIVRNRILAVIDYLNRIQVK